MESNNLYPKEENNGAKGNLPSNSIIQTILYYDIFEKINQIEKREHIWSLREVNQEIMKLEEEELRRVFRKKLF